MSNLTGGLTPARKQFTKDLQDDKDFQIHRKDAEAGNFGTVSTYEDPFCNDGQIFRKLVKRYESLTAKPKKHY